MTIPASVMAEMADHPDRFAADNYAFAGLNNGPLPSHMVAGCHLAAGGCTDRADAAAAR